MVIAMRTRSLLAAALCALTVIAVVPAPAEAAFVNDVMLNIPSGSNWVVGTLTAPAPCVQIIMNGNVTGSGGSAAGAFWIREGTGLPVRGLFWTEGQSFRVVFTQTTGGVIFGSTPTIGGTFGYQVTFPSFCGTSGGYTQVAYVVPTAANARLRIDTSNGAGLASSYSGNNAFIFNGRQMSGLLAEVEDTSVLFGQGASVAYQKSKTLTVPAGMMAWFDATDQVTLLQANGPFGQKQTTCIGPGYSSGFTCGSISATEFTRLGGGTAPAGSYTFTIRAEAGAEALHVIGLGAPINW